MTYLQWGAEQNAYLQVPEGFGEGHSPLTSRGDGEGAHSQVGALRDGSFILISDTLTSSRDITMHQVYFWCFFKYFILNIFRISPGLPNNVYLIIL